MPRSEDDMGEWFARLDREKAAAPEPLSKDLSEAIRQAKSGFSAEIVIGPPAAMEALIGPGVRTVTEHELKTWPSQFQAVANGTKTFEWRKNDRDFQVGDVLVLREYDPGPTAPFLRDIRGYTGRSVAVEVTYVLREGFGIPPGYAVLAIRRIDDKQEG